MSQTQSRKRRAILLVCYHYLSTPVYQALKKQLTDFHLFYVFPKDPDGSDTNYRHFDRGELKTHDPDYVELPYDPPWFRGQIIWHVRTKREKLWLWIRWIWSFRRFKRELVSLVRGLRPDLIMTTSDMFFVPRYLAHKLPDIPVVVLQPCYLDLWQRERRYGFRKRLVNFLQPMVFETQQYFGFEIPRATLLVWDQSSFDIYASRNRPAIKVICPTHLDIRERAVVYRTQERAAILGALGVDSSRPVISFFTAYYADVKGHGTDYQHQLEQSLVAVIKQLATKYSIVVKVHPNEDLNYWKNVFRELPEGATMVHNCDRFRLLAASDFLISTNSYASVEATLSGCVSINFVPGVRIIGDAFCAPFNKHAAITCNSETELIDLLMHTADPAAALREAVARAQEEILGEKDGNRRVEDVLGEIVRS